MGILIRRQASDTTQIGSNEPRLVDSNTYLPVSSRMPDPWLAFLIVLVVLIVSVLGIILYMNYLGSQGRRRANVIRSTQRRNSPFPWGRSRRADKRQKAEMQVRRSMIEKALASRTSFVSSASTEYISQAPSNVGPRETTRDSFIDDQGDEEEEVGLKEDWKRWEAQVQTERRLSTPGGVGLDQHPAFASEPLLPPPLRLSSHVRSASPLRAEYRSLQASALPLESTPHLNFI
ncbi:hypothetical protein F5Y16DRAFT_370994 [Xylariaceae sp. FL0255]|nr:hypothetical protein F5Y16DRAFT_370994 [Xylariaceae sp. FL0255]